MIGIGYQFQYSSGRLLQTFRIGIQTLRNFALPTKRPSPVMTASVSNGAAAKPHAATTPALLTDYLPMSILTDSYKASHFLQYPAATKMVAVRLYTLNTCPVLRLVNLSLYTSSTENSAQGTTMTRPIPATYGTAFGTS